MSQPSLEPVENRLLAMLPQEEMERLLPHLEPVTFALGEVIYESGGQQSYIYFPTTVIISLLYMMENGSSAEMGVAGNEGMDWFLTCAVASQSWTGAVWKRPSASVTG